MNRTSIAARLPLAKTAFIACVFLASAVAVTPALAKEKYSIDPITGTKYKPDDDMKDLLVTYAALGAKPVDTLTPEQARLQPTLMDAANALAKKRGLVMDQSKLMTDVTTVDATIPVSTENELTATLYTPAGPGPFPAVVFFHGGGWVLGNPKVDDVSLRTLAKEAQVIVIRVQYRLAPEHKFPAAWDDALAAYRWTCDNIVRWRGDPRRLALAGESAGGTLALATAIASVDAGLTRPKAVIAIYPITQTGSVTESYVDSARAKVLNKAAVSWFMSETLNSGGG